VIRRRAFRFVASLSLMLCVPIVFLWVRSYWAGDAVVVSFLLRENDPAADFVEMDSYQTACIQSEDGLFMAGGGVSWEQHFGPARRAACSYFTQQPPLTFRDNSTVWRRLGFLIDSGPDGLTYLSFPFWVVVSVFLVLPATGVVRRWRRCEGLCSYCDYDLTDNTSGVCPECGTPVPGKPQARAVPPKRGDDRSLSESWQP
jgi:hypothetical protein